MNHLMIAIGILWSLVPTDIVGADDLWELREAAQQAEGQGLKALVGRTCTATKTIFVTDGNEQHVLRQFEVRGSFSSTSQWYVKVWLDPTRKQGDADAVIAQDGRLGYTGVGLNSPSPKMTSYSFGDEERQQLLYSAETYFPSIITGGNFFDVSFSSVTKFEGFKAQRSPSEDSPLWGRCWDWSFEEQDEIPPYEGSVWMRDFGDDVHVIGRIKFRIRGTDRFTEVRNIFSTRTDRPSLIERVEVDHNGGSTSFVINTIESEDEPRGGYAPERFGLTTPSDPWIAWWWRFAGIAFFGLIAAYITFHYRKKS